MVNPQLSTLPMASRDPRRPRTIQSCSRSNAPSLCLKKRSRLRWQEVSRHERTVLHAFPVNPSRTPVHHSVPLGPDQRRGARMHPQTAFRLALLLVSATFTSLAAKIGATWCQTWAGTRVGAALPAARADALASAPGRHCVEPALGARRGDSMAGCMRLHVGGGRLRPAWGGASPR